MQLVHVTGSMLVAKHAVESIFSSMSSSGRLSSAPIKRDWVRITWSSDERLVPEIPDDPPYRYDFLVHLSREDPARLIITSSHIELVEAFLRESGIARDYRKPRLQVAALVQHIADDPDEYRTTVLYARVDGFGQDLRTIAFFGDNITSATLSRDILRFAEPFRVTLRRTKSESDVLSVGSRGEISFMFNDRVAALDRVDHALRFIKPWTQW